MKYYLLTFGLAFSGLIVELGPAEAADKFVRPALLYEIPRSLHNIIAGFILAKLTADIVYYVLAYAGRVVRKRYFNNLDWASGAVRRYAIHARANHGRRESAAMLGPMLTVVDFAVSWRPRCRLEPGRPGPSAVMPASGHNIALENPAARLPVSHLASTFRRNNSA